jgi:hypothetical protein
VPFIFATGYGADGIRGNWPRVPVLQKPFQIRELAAAIEQNMEFNPPLSIPKDRYDGCDVAEIQLRRK